MKIGNLPQDVHLFSLKMHLDQRGCFTEIFRQEWNTGVYPLQWNAVSSESGVFRGVHAHLRHDDYLILLKGTMSIGLYDLRADSSTKNQSALVKLTEDAITAIQIPHGVAHGFYFHTPSLHIYSVTEYWDIADELACHWSDPELNIPWPAQPFKISERDANAPSLKELKRQFLETAVEKNIPVVPAKSITSL